ncbi:MAG: GNAT family N-acetyltransferase [Hyphomicrobiaceae bacterium]
MGLTLNRLFARSGPPLRNGRVLLVEPDIRHYEMWSLLRESSRQHLEPFEPAWSPDELSRGAFRRRLRRYRLDRRRGTGAAFLIQRAADNTLLGGVTLTNIRRGVTQSASVGYWIGLPFIRQGYASEALEGVLRYAFEQLELNRVEAACMPRNRASIGVLERAAFRHEGLARRYLMINGTFEDHLLFARLRHDAEAKEVVAGEGTAAAERQGMPDAGQRPAAATELPATTAEGRAA